MASDLQTQLKGFYDEAWQAGTLMVAQPALNAYPQALLVSQAQYPDFEHFDWQDLSALYQVVQTCQPNPRIVVPRLLVAQRFELALCREQPLPVEWFEKNPLLHPAGGSYAERYLSHYAIKTPPPELVERVTLANKNHPLHGALAALSQSGRDALLNGYRAYLDGDRLWLNGEEGWKALPRTQWTSIADNYRLSLSTHSTGCDYRYGNICNQLHPAYRGVMIAILVAIFGALVLGLARSVYDGYQQRRERQLLYGPIKVEPGSRNVYWQNESVMLKPKEFDLLLLLIQNPGRVFHREELLNKIWGYQAFPTTRTVGNHVLRLRQKLPDLAIETHRGVGYRLVML